MVAPGVLCQSDDAGSGRIEIVITGGRRIVVDRVVDIEVLVRLVRALERP